MPRAGVDDVFGALPAQIAGALFAQAPANSVDDVALAGTIGSDKGRYSRSELEAGGASKALETVDIEGLQVQRLLRTSLRSTSRQPPAIDEAVNSCRGINVFKRVSLRVPVGQLVRRSNAR